MQHHSEHSLPWQWYTYSMRSHVSVGLIFFYIYRFTCFIFLLFFLPFIFEFISPPLFLFICYYLRYIHPPPRHLFWLVCFQHSFFFFFTFFSFFFPLVFVLCFPLYIPFLQFSFVSYYFFLSSNFGMCGWCNGRQLGMGNQRV